MGQSIREYLASMACVYELQGESRFDSFLLLPTFFQSTINASTHHDVLICSTPKRIRSPSPFPRYQFQVFRVPPPCEPLSMRFSNRFRIYCDRIARLNLSRPGGGAGVRARPRVFLYYHNTPHEIFRHKVPPTHRPRAAREAWIDPRSEGVVLCSWFEVFV